MNELKRKIIEYLAERDVWVRPKTYFEKEPCYLCQEFDPFMNLAMPKEPYRDCNSPYYDPDRYDCQQLPCDHRRNYCHSFDKLCSKYKEAGKTFWSAERWRIENKPNYHFMNANMWREHKPEDESIILCGELRQ